jgi:hypothetical protein
VPAARSRLVSDREVLAVLVGIVLAAAVARGDVQRAVGANGELPAVVVALAMRDGQRRHPCRQRAIGIGGIAPALLDAQRPVACVRVEDPEAPARRVVGRERHGEQPALALDARRAADVEERLRQRRAAAHDAHPSAPLDHEHA